MMNKKWSRRRLLQLVGAGATAGIAGCTGSDGSNTPTPTDTVPSPMQSAETPTDTAVETTAAPTDERPSTFVTREGTDFVVDGNRFVFSGVANCCLAEGYTSKERVDDVLAGASDLDADVIRFKAGSAGGSSTCGEAVDGCDLSFQPEPGSFNETAFKHLDYIVDEAGKRGMRVILPLVDNWGSTGMKQYIAWSDTASAHDEFYTDDRVNKLYRGFVEHLLTRTNSITGREYRKDPTILMWELANEPRVQTNYSGFLSWVEDTAGFIHELDGKHLVSTGSDVYEPERYEEVHSVNGIDACSIHLWPQNWDRADTAESFGKQYLKDRIQRGHEQVGKPVYLGEYGWRVNLQADNLNQQLTRRNTLFSAWQTAALSAGVDGAIAWELLSDSRLEYHRTEAGQGDTVGFACPDHEETCAVLRSFAQDIDNRSAVA